MNLKKYLTHQDKIFRDFARFALSQEDSHKYKIIEGTIDYIPDEYTFVEEINIYNQNLTEIPRRVLYCKYLYCGDNKLESLPELPYCKILSCGVNKLTSLPHLPLCVKLYCQYNKLTTFPNLPSCEYLYCWDNKLKSLPSLPYCNSNCKIII